jgi:hypothetical protein
MRRVAVVAAGLIVVAGLLTIWPTPYSYEVMRRGSVDYYVRIPRLGGAMEYKHPDGRWSRSLPAPRPMALPIDAPRDAQGLDPDIAKILASSPPNR